MSSIEKLKQQREALLETLASGTLEVTIGEQTVKYASASDILSRIRHLDSMISAMTASYGPQSNTELGGGYSVQAIPGRGKR